MPRGRPPLTPEEKERRRLERAEYRRKWIAAKRGSTSNTRGPRRKYTTPEAAAEAKRRQQLEWSARRPRKKKVEKILPEV